MKKTLLMLAETAIFAGLALLFDFLAGSILRISIAGGSLSIAMLPIFLVSYRWGIKSGLLCGAITGLIQILWGSGFINPLQVIMDYVLAYTVLGFSSILFYFAKQKDNLLFKILFISLGVLLGVFIRFVIATISGIVFWEVEFVASMIYNLTYLLPSMVACLILLCILVPALKKYTEQYKKDF